jgi:hypothetical protein
VPGTTGLGWRWTIVPPTPSVTINGVPLDEVVRLLGEAAAARPGIFVGEIELVAIVRLYDGPGKNEIGRIEFTAPGGGAGSSGRPRSPASPWPGRLR